MQNSANTLTQHPGHTAAAAQVWPLNIAEAMNEFLTTEHPSKVKKFFHDQLQYWLEDERGLDPLTDQLSLAYKASTCSCQYALLYNYIIRLNSAFKHFSLYHGWKYEGEGENRELTPEGKEKQRLNQLTSDIAAAYAHSVIDVRSRENRRAHPLNRQEFRHTLYNQFDRFILTPTFNGKMHLLTKDGAIIPVDLIRTTFQKHGTTLEKAMRFTLPQSVAYSDITRAIGEHNKLDMLLKAFTTYAPHPQVIQQLYSALALFFLLEELTTFEAVAARLLVFQRTLEAHIQLLYWPPPPITAEHQALTTSVLTSAPPAPDQPVAGA